MHPDLWYKEAIIYCLDVETYVDSNADGIGDFPGLTSRLDYLKGIGVTCVWLLPFYPSPNRDNGYDVTDYFTVDPRLGSLGDFVEFARQAQDRGIRVVIDLVVNHTSDQHPWFKAARSDPNSPFRDWYIWSDRKPKDADRGVVFPGVQEAIWSYDPEAGAWYHHRFYKHQPDLNIANPAVRSEIMKIMGFWLQMGVSGFRVDAAPFVLEVTSTNGAGATTAFEFLEEFRWFLSWRKGDAILLAEANLPPGQILTYFGKRDKLHMLFNFWVNQHTFLAIARGDAGPLIKSLKELPTLPPEGQWASFLRNHDEVDLGRLTDEDRQAVFAEMGPEPEMQLYDRGIRRRLAPMLRGDKRRLQMAYSLVFSLPGSPVLWYGEEIGMGDDLSLPERNSVRTPMQWDRTENGGFSAAPRKMLCRPVLADGPYGYQHINVADQRRKSESLLNFVEKLIRTRRECPEVGWGKWELLKTDDSQVFAHRCEWRGRSILFLHNLAEAPCVANVKLGATPTRTAEIFGDQGYDEPLDSAIPKVRLAGYGFRWIVAEGLPELGPITEAFEAGWKAGASRPPDGRAGERPRRRDAAPRANTAAARKR